MNRFTTLLGSTTIAALALTAPAALAVHDELTQLETAVKAELAALEMAEIDMSTLTLAQVAEIHSILEGDLSDNDKRTRIEAIASVEKNYVYPDSLANITGGDSSLRDIVNADLIALNIETDVDALTVSQLVQISSALQADASNDDKSRNIQAIIEQ